MINIVRDFLLEPVILIGVIVFIGLVLQRKGFEVVVKGTLKAMIGFMIISTVSYTHLTLPTICSV